MYDGLSSVRSPISSALQLLIDLRMNMEHFEFSAIMTRRVDQDLMNSLRVSFGEITRFVLLTAGSIKQVFGVLWMGFERAKYVIFFVFLQEFPV